MINSNIENAEGVILSANLGQSYSLRGGADKGPQKTIDTFLYNLEAFDRFTLNEPYSLNKVGHHELKGLNIVSLGKAVDRIKKFYQQNKNKFILMLGGSHPVSIGAFQAISEQYKAEEVTILQIDAHPDMRDDSSDYKEKPSKLDHGCVMHRAVELGFNTIQVGIRTISIFDHEFITKNNLKVFEWGTDNTPTVSEIIDSIKTDKVYLTFDMDGLDPSVAPGTGTPVPGGLDWNYASKLIRELISKKDLIGADIVEIAPLKDDVLTPYVAAHLCYNIISYKLLKMKGKLNFINK